MTTHAELIAISPLDGRYREIVKKLAGSMSEYGRIRYRVAIEIAYLFALSDEKEIPFTIEKSERDILERMAQVKEDDAIRIKEIERETRRDEKAVEQYIRERFQGTTLQAKAKWVHFGLTSEDVNNIAHALILREGVGVLLETLDRIIAVLSSLAVEHAATAMLARTHGQSASSTTFGKEMRIFVSRLAHEREKLAHVRIGAKLHGTNGNYHALAMAFPKTDWPRFSERFIASLNDTQDTIQIVSTLHTTQREPHDSVIELFQLLHRINSILTGLTADMVRYISEGWVTQKAKAGEVGSSHTLHTMHTIEFQNSEENLSVANALFEYFVRTCSTIQLPCDFKDSTPERNVGSAFAYSLIGYESLVKGLSRSEPDAHAMTKALEAHPEIIVEAIQSILRREDQQGAYEKLEELTRNAALTLEDIRVFVKGLIIDEHTKKMLLNLTPATYVGLAEELAKG